MKILPELIKDYRQNEVSNHKENNPCKKSSSSTIDWYSYNPPATSVIDSLMENQN